MQNQQNLMKQSRENLRKLDFRPFWTVFGLFWTDLRPKHLFSVNFAVLVVEYHGHLLECAKLAKSNEAKSRKSPKNRF